MGEAGQRPAGRQIGAYQLVALLGKGGMGEVYRAVDRTLGREVAIKILPEAFMSDPARLARLHREARLLASLNHPNIATVHSLEEADRSCGLVMELVAGQTLAERVAAGALPIDEVLRVCHQIAEALDAAHQKGITHRDIKPANIKVTPHGIVKVLDFGLAKIAAHDEASAALVATETGTAAGVVLGTAPYMSPEQARGRAVDKQTDIWAFGCVLYELLTGRPAFCGETAPDTIAAILGREPNWGALPEATPASVRRLLRRCLEKDTQRRLRDIGDARIELHDALQSAGIGPSASVGGFQSLAVLPFANASSDPEMEYLSDGLTESIILALSSLPQLRVMSRSAVFPYKRRSHEALAVGQALAVDTVLTGKVLQRGETLSISAELVDVEHGWQLWGGQYRRKSADLLAVEEEIANEISEKLRSKLTPEKPELRVRHYTENAAAYHLYLKGRFYAGKRTEEGLQKALHHFRQAIDLDPTYALAYVGLTQAYAPLVVYCHVAPRDAVPKIRAAAQYALDIDPGLTEARTACGGTKAFHEWDVQGGEQEVRAAIALNPTSRWSWQLLAEILTIQCRFAEAADAATRAFDIDPLALNINAFMSMTHYFGRQYDMAIEHGRKTIEMDPSFFPGHFWLGMAHHLNGEFAAAAAALQRAAALSSESSLMVACLGGVFAGWGKKQEAHEILRQLSEVRRRRYVSQVAVAAIWAALGETDRALSCLEDACSDRCYWLLYGLMADARFDPLREEPRFTDLVRRVHASR